jgi:hypothetical protein
MSSWMVDLSKMGSSSSSKLLEQALLLVYFDVFIMCSLIMFDLVLLYVLSILNLFSAIPDLRMLFLGPNEDPKSLSIFLVGDLLQSFTFYYYSSIVAAWKQVYRSAAPSSLLNDTIMSLLRLNNIIVN